MLYSSTNSFPPEHQNLGNHFINNYRKASASGGLPQASINDPIPLQQKRNPV